MKILGTGSALPHLTVTNDMLSTFLDTSDAWIRTRTGIAQRQVISDETVEELAVAAARTALDNAGITAAEVDMILCSNVLSSHITPAMACRIQGALQASCPAVDLNGACAGFVYGLDMAEAYLRSGMRKCILLVCAEHTTRMADWTDRSTCVLFGDGAGAVVLGPGDALKAMELTCQYDGEVLTAATAPGNNPYLSFRQEPNVYLQMKGQDVFKFAVNQATQGIRTVLQRAGLEMDQVRYFLLHQANLRILRAVCSRLEQPMERFPSNLERTGNTSSASIPILLDEMHRARQLQRGDMIVISAFGAGLVSGTCVLEWQI